MDQCLWHFDRVQEAWVGIALRERGKLGGSDRNYLRGVGGGALILPLLRWRTDKDTEESEREINILAKDKEKKVRLQE